MSLTITPTEGQVVTADTSGISDADGLAAFNYQWEVFNGSAWVAIAGATAVSFTPVQAQVDKSIRVVVKYTDGDGTLETLTSAASAVVGDLYNGTSASNLKTLTNGEDIANGLNGNDTLNGLGGIDILSGGNGSDTLNGGDGNDTLNGDANDDTLIGGAGADTMAGGTGNDTYSVDEFDTVTEAAAAGTDTIDTTLNSYSLAALANVENLSFSGDGNFTGTGSTVVNRIEGGEGNDILDGLGGNDVLIGGLGDDTYFVTQQGEVAELAGEGIDTINSVVTYSLLGATVSAVTVPGNSLANVENLTLLGSTNINATGNALDNILVGNTGNNTLSGGTLNASGADTMSGGLGNDIYLVDNAGDTVIENLGQGTDTVQTSLATYTLADNVENLTIVASQPILFRNFTGNGLNNTITANGGNDVVTGGAGNDIVNGGGGNDTFMATVSDGNDTYNGGTGATSIDTYDLSGLSSSVTISIEGANLRAIGAQNGSDLLTSMENLIGSQVGDSITVNGAANVLDGRGGADNLNAGGGNDILIGGAGDDLLSGGTGFDTFMFAAGFGNDTIFDFDAIGGGSLVDQDLLDLSAFGITDFNTEVGITDLGAGGTLVSFGADTITLTGVNFADVTVNDFIIV